MNDLLIAGTKYISELIEENSSITTISLGIFRILIK